ncbi:MAG: hypothetical protein AB1416_11540 [Actinomycetota bacterium]
MPPHAAAVARGLARRAAAGRPVSPAIFATDPRERYVCVSAERDGGVHMVVRVADRSGRHVWRAPVDAAGEIGEWRRAEVTAGRAGDIEDAFRLAPA